MIETFRFDRASIEYILSISFFLLYIAFRIHSKKNVVAGLIEHLLPKRKTKAKRNLQPIDMLLITLQYYATGTFQTVVGNVLRYSQSSVSRSIACVSLALAMISKDHISFPADLQKVF